MILELDYHTVTTAAAQDSITYAAILPLQLQGFAIHQLSATRLYLERTEDFAWCMLALSSNSNFSVKVAS